MDIKELHTTYDLDDKNRRIYSLVIHSVGELYTIICTEKYIHTITCSKFESINGQEPSIIWIAGKSTVRLQDVFTTKLKMALTKPDVLKLLKSYNLDKLIKELMEEVE